MPYETIEEALADANQEQLIKAAKGKGYDPLKDSRTIENRDSLLSAKAKAERDAETYKARMGVLEKEAEEATSKAANLEKEAATIKEKYGNFDEIRGKVEAYEAKEKARLEQVKKDYDGKIAAWVEKDPEIKNIIPDYGDDIERKLDWMSKNEKRLFGEQMIPVKVPNEPAIPAGGIPESVIKEAEQIGISPEKLYEMKKKQNPNK